MLRSIGICLLAMSLTTSLNAAPAGTRLHYLVRGPKVANAQPPLLLLLQLLLQLAMLMAEFVFLL